jgi:hypothetical protein
MTIKSYNAGSLALSEIQAEFGGSNPIALSEYYAGGSYVTSGTVGYPNGSAVSIPSSGAISISNFYGASAEPNAVARANYFWNNRANLVRFGRDPQMDYYPGDNFSLNNYNFRFVSSGTNTWSYSNSGLSSSSMYYTMVGVAAGAIGNYPTITQSSSPGSLYSENGPYTYVGDGVQPTSVGNGYGINIRTRTFNGQVKDVTSTSIYTSHRGGNNGAFTYCYLIPGIWAFSYGVANFDGNNYSITIAAGQIHFMFVERGGDYPNPLPTPSGAANVMTADNFWYNGASVQVVVNTSSSPITVTWPASGSIVGNTPIISALLTSY